MTELLIILIAVINIALFFGRAQSGYVLSRREEICFVLSLPVALLSSVALFVLGGPVVLSVIVAAVICLGILLLLSEMAEGGASA